MLERHHDISRLEGFSDAVFAIALALLVVSLETPKTMHELEQFARGFLPFAMMFAMVCWIWYAHNLFFRRYGLQDGWTVVLNSFLLFVVLFYVYPLKFLTNNLLGPLFGVDDASHERIADGRLVMLLYSGGIVLIFATLAALYGHAWRRRHDLELSPADAVTLRFGLSGHLWTMGIGLTSIAIVLMNARWSAIAGFIYFLIGPAQAWNGHRQGRAQRARETAAVAPTAPSRKPGHAKR
jgi:uncharacterized membrane protein